MHSNIWNWSLWMVGKLSIGLATHWQRRTKLWRVTEICVSLRLGAFVQIWILFSSRKTYGEIQVWDFRAMGPTLLPVLDSTLAVPCFLSILGTRFKWQNRGWSPGSCSNRSCSRTIARNSGSFFGRLYCCLAWLLSIQSGSRPVGCPICHSSVCPWLWAQFWWKHLWSGTSTSGTSTSKYFERIYGLYGLCTWCEEVLAEESSWSSWHYVRGFALLERTLCVQDSHEVLQQNSCRGAALIFNFAA